MKFGGTSVADGAALGRVLDIVATRSGRRAVVVSALAGVTDALVAIAGAAGAGDREGVARELAALEGRHERMAAAVISDRERLASLRRVLAVTFATLAETCADAAERHEVTPVEQDSILAAGEVLSSHLAAAALLAAGTDAVWVDARAVVVTDARHTNASPLMEPTRRRVAALVGPALEADRVPVLGGFIGATPDGRATTLGRGGSDYSAAIVAAALDADAVEIWTDVDGVFTADPRIVPGARPIDRLSFGQAFELALFGAKVLHPRTVQPACEAGIPIRILNTWVPLGAGTLVTADGGHAQDLVGIAVRRDVVVLEVSEDASPARPGFLAELLRTVERCGLEPLTIDGSADCVRLVAPAAAGSRATLSCFDSLGRVVRRDGLALVSVFGSVLTHATEARRLLAELADVPTDAILQAQGGPALALLVPAAVAADVVRRLHDLLFEGTAAATRAVRTEAQV
jgi:aspartate kinase